MSARGFEHWADAYARILGEVEVEHPDWDERARYHEYRRRCAQWKLDRGMALSSADIAALAPVLPEEGNTNGR